MSQKEFNLDRAKSIDGWMPEAELLILALLATGRGPILEIGSYKGRSTAALLDNGVGPVHCVDPWIDSYYDQGQHNVFGEFVENHHSAIENGKLFVNKMPFEEYKTNQKFELIFIDGHHGYEAVKHDIRKAKKLIKPGGLICGHDFHPVWMGVMKAVVEAFSDKITVNQTIWCAETK